MPNHSLTAIRVVIAGLITNNHNTKGVTAMNENLKKILSASIDGYIYHTDEAERIVSDLTKLTSAELDPTKDSYILQNIDAYLEFLEQKDMDKEAVTCGEYIGILDSFVNDPGANEDEKRELVIRQSLYNLLYALRDNRGGNTVIKLFKAVTVDSYFECLSKKAGKQEDFLDYFLNFRFNFKSATDRCIDEETTVSDFFEIIISSLNKRWDILSPIEEYKEKIETLYDLIYVFFVENFKNGFPEYFNKIKFNQPYNCDDFDLYIPDKYLPDIDFDD